MLSRTLRLTGRQPLPVRSGRMLGSQIREDDMERMKLFAAKRKLYLALLELPPDAVTEDDLRCMAALGKDSELRGYLRDAFKSHQPNRELDRNNITPATPGKGDMYSITNDHRRVQEPPMTEAQSDAAWDRHCDARRKTERQDELDLLAGVLDERKRREGF